MADIAAIARHLRDGAGWIGAQAAALRRRADTALGRDHLRIGVTGLAGAGKTVFTTSLVHALRHGGAHPAAAGAPRSRICRTCPPFPTPPISPD